MSAVVNFCCYYLIGLPIGIVLSLLFRMGALGLCLGLACANVLQVSKCISFADETFLGFGNIVFCELKYFVCIYTNPSFYKCACVEMLLIPDRLIFL